MNPQKCKWKEKWKTTYFLIFWSWMHTPCFIQKLDFTLLVNSLHWCVHSTTHWNEMKKEGKTQGCWKLKMTSIQTTWNPNSKFWWVLQREAWQSMLLFWGREAYLGFLCWGVPPMFQQILVLLGSAHCVRF